MSSDDLNQLIRKEFSIDWYDVVLEEVGLTRKTPAKFLVTGNPAVTLPVPLKRLRRQWHTHITNVLLDNLCSSGKIQRGVYEIFIEPKAPVSESETKKGIRELNKTIRESLK